ncbi:MAG: RDD family protein [Acidobacteria bacterium]|nr:RDD family protein [Acidobacteriota bacterium]
MMNDSVREELEAKITSGGLRPIVPAVEAKPLEMRLVDEPPPVKKEPVVRESAIPVSAPPPVKRTLTADLTSPKTSPTLVEFQTQKATLPDWRLQIQNAVQQRVGSTSTSSTTATAAAPALKQQPVRVSEPTVMIPDGADPRVAAAMKRVDESRKAFLPKTPAQRMAAIKPVPPIEARPFNVVPKTPAPVTRTASGFTAPKSMPAPAQPRMVVPSAAAVTPAAKVDTNKLPKLEAVIAEKKEQISKPLPAIKLVEKPVIPRVEPLPETVEETPDTEFAQIARIRIRAEHLEIEASEHDEPVADEIEDLAPFSMRFGAGLFDLIIGGFAAMLLLSPIAFSGGDWLTPIGGLTFAGVWALVLFVYMTASLGFYGKTLGMRLFSLELVDAVENEYPTLQQAAVNTALFVITLPLAGAGFVTCFFNEENRAAHDLLSGTILVREF